MPTSSKDKILNNGAVPSKNITLQTPPQPLGKTLTEQELAAEQANEQKPAGLRGQLADSVANSKKVLGNQVSSNINAGADETSNVPQEDITVKTPQDKYGYKMLLDAFTDEEQRIADEEARMKRNKLFTTIGDGLSAFHEAYSHARGLKPMTNGSSLTGKWRERMDQLQADRNKNRMAHINAMMNIRNARDLEDYRKENMKIRQQQQDRLEAQANLALRKQDWLEKYQQGRLDLDREAKEIDRQYKQGLITKMERDAASRELTAQAAWLRAQKYNSGGSGGSGGGSGSLANNPNYAKETVTTEDPVTGAKTTKTSYVRKGTGNGGNSGKVGIAAGKGGNNKGGKNKNKVTKYTNVSKLGI